MSVMDEIRARLEASEKARRSVKQNLSPNNTNASPSTEHYKASLPPSPASLSLSPLPAAELNINLTTTSINPLFEPYDYLSSETPPTTRNHPIYGEVYLWRRKSEGQCFSRNAWRLEHVRVTHDCQGLERHAKFLDGLICHQKHLLTDERFENSRLERSVKLGGGKLLQRVLRLWRYTAANEKEFKQAQAELVEAIKTKRTAEESCSQKEELVGLLMAEKEELKERCGELESKVQEREESLDMF